jgi:predicted nicotinamide N-methyase
MSSPHETAGEPTHLEALERELRRRFRTAESTVETAAGKFELLHPANADDLISEADFVADERLPYWADIWPSSTVLAGRVGRAPGGGRAALELGCGLGLVASAAARAGYAMTATDYYEDALLFARVNAWRNAGVEIASQHLDWRDLPSTLATFDLVVASDVLYERTYGPLVAAVFARALSPAGLGIVADPGRLAAPAFIDECAERGLEAAVAEQLPFAAGEVRQTIALYEVRWRAGRRGPM